MARSPVGWQPEKIKTELRLRHGPITTLSVTWGYARVAITQCLRRPDFSRNVERKIAEALDVPLHELWPSRWRPDGTWLPRCSDFDPIPSPRVQNSQKRQAA